ncbi:hypothetical protein DYU11_19175 [Fibrisoma montanum]|uniref:Uncharacterized protein n=1 Tax=Fibrisoma montanum TaxID=2305895 RepID=A0A418M6U8_9BACT|nr:hypothetical protein [Fibrisoma montanum]RIV21526.1 hypothetical protein DYU11_19175 [Fibrisoma montanum]
MNSRAIIRASFLTTGLISMTLFMQCQSNTDELSASAPPTSFPDSLFEPPTEIRGRVAIKMEPHGSIRAKVFQGDRYFYEYILDRERQQNILVRDINNAAVYLQNEHLIIDDLAIRHRYVLTFKDNSVQKFLTRLPTGPKKTFIIRGYGSSLTHSRPLGLDNY